MESHELKEVDFKNCTCYCFDDIIKIEDFDFDILTDEKSHRNIWLMACHTKLCLVQNHCVLDLMTILLEFMMGLDI